MGSPLRVPILGGINVYDSDDAIDPGEVVDSSNFLFEGRRAITRPGTGLPFVLNTLDPLFARWFPQVINNVVIPVGAANGFGILTDGVSFRSFDSPFPTSLSAALAGPALGGSQAFINADVVNGNILISLSDGNGLYRFIPGSGAYTQLVAPQSAFQYVTGLQSRAIGALLLNPTTHQNVVGWSATGDETNWTTLDSGATTINDIPDVITGLGVLHNVVVVLRSLGLHLGTTTGVAPPNGPVFRFESFTRSGGGCYFPGTSAFWDNFCMYVGIDDVYKFDMQSITPVGGKIKDILITLLGQLYSTKQIVTNSPITYTAFFTHSASYIDPKGDVISTDLEPRLRYNLVPQIKGGGVFVPALMPSLPHFVYDLAEDKWSIHNYSFPAIGGYDAQTPAIFSTDPTTVQRTVRQWDITQPQEAGAFLLGGVLTIESVEMNYKLLQALLKYRDYGESQGVRVTVNLTRQDVSDSATDVQVIGTPQATLKWMRQYFDLNVAGQFVQWRIDVDPGVPLETNYLSIRYTPAGEFRQILGVANA